MTDRFLICENSRCRFVLDLFAEGKMLSRRSLHLSNCPECGATWSLQCPFCSHTLEVTWIEELPHCGRCLQKLQAADV